MKITPTNYTPGIINNDLSNRYNRLKTSNDTYTRTASVKSISFGQAPAELAKEVINNIKLEVKGKNAIKAFLALLGLAAGSYDVKLSEVLGLINQNGDDEDDEFNNLKQENERLREENSRLKSQLDSAQEGTFIPDFRPIPEEEITDDTVYIIGSNEPILASKEQPSEPNIEPIPLSEESDTEATTDDAVYVLRDTENETTEDKNATLKPVMFPKKHGRLSKVQEELKTVVSEVLLPDEDGKKLSEICSILISNKYYVTKSGKSIPCEDLAKLLAENIIRAGDCAQLVRKCYAKMELDEQTTDIPAEEGDLAEAVPEEDVSGQSDGSIAGRKHADTSYLELKTHPLEQPKVLGTVDLSRMGRYGKPKTDTPEKSETPVQETVTPEENKLQSGGRKRRIFTPGMSESATSEVGTSIARSEEIADPAEGLITKLETTSDDPRILFAHFPIGNRAVDLFSAPETFVYDSPFGKGKYLKFKRDTVGEFAAILMELEGYYDNSKGNEVRRENVKIWANRAASQLDDGSENEGAAVEKGTTIRLQTDKYAAANIKAVDVIQEITTKSDDDYTNIKTAIFGTTETNGDKILVKHMDNIIDDIVDAINEDERFANFSLHGAMRLIERLVDFDSDIPIQDQCCHILDRLFALMEQAIDIGVQVKTYMYANRKTDKFDNLIVKIAPNIVIPAELYTLEDKKLFKNVDLIISLCEYQPGGEYVKSLKQPLIKTLVINNKW